MLEIFEYNSWNPFAHERMTDARVSPNALLDAQINFLLFS